MFIRSGKKFDKTHEEFCFQCFHVCSSTSSLCFSVSSLQLQRRYLCRRCELVSLWVRPRIRRTGLSHQWVPWEPEGACGGVRWAGGQRWKAVAWECEPIVSGRQIRKPFRKTVLTSPLYAEPRSELRFVRRVTTLSCGLLEEISSERPFQKQSVIQLKRFKPLWYNPIVQKLNSIACWKYLNMKNLSQLRFFSAKVYFQIWKDLEEKIHKASKTCLRWKKTMILLK